MIIEGFLCMPSKVHNNTGMCFWCLAEVPAQAGVEHAANTDNSDIPQMLHSNLAWK